MTRLVEQKTSAVHVLESPIAVQGDDRRNLPAGTLIAQPASSRRRNPMVSSPAVDVEDKKPDHQQGQCRLPGKGLRPPARGFAVRISFP